MLAWNAHNVMTYQVPAPMGIEAISRRYIRQFLNLMRDEISWRWGWRNVSSSMEQEGGKTSGKDI